VLASSAGEEVRYTGLLSRILWQEGTPAEAAERLAGGPQPCRLIAPEPGRRYALT
jgi:hypothetical protein